MHLLVKISPNAKTNQIIGWQNEWLKIKIATPPVDGKANKALIKFLADFLSIPTRDITIESGHASRQKILDIKGVKRGQLDKVFPKQGVLVEV